MEIRKNKDGVELPLLVQSDRTMLLDTHSPLSDMCRKDIMVFSDLIKSPEHMHTYALSPLSIWNAESSGLTGKEILNRLERWSKYELDERIVYFINDQACRYGSFFLEEYNDEYMILRVKREELFLELAHKEELSTLLYPSKEKMSFLVKKLDRGTLKVKMIKLSFPVVDNIPLLTGDPLPFSIKENTILRDFQNESLKSFFDGGGYGNIVLPCGSGKTVVGIGIMERLKTKTLILCPNISAVHQWINELLNRTTLNREDIGEYSGEEKEIRPVTVSTYQVLTKKRKKINEEEEDYYPHLELFTKEKWGLVIYDEVHVLPAPIFRITAEIQAIFRLGLTATLIREDGKEDEVFSLVGPKRYDSPWTEIEEKGFIAKANCHEVRVSLPKEMKIEYAVAEKRDKNKIAAMNPEKIKVTEKLLERHKGEQILIIGQYLEQLRQYKEYFGFPIITGVNNTKTRDDTYEKFRKGEIKVMIVSKVANFALDLPDASVLIQISGTFGSRQEEAQRLGRILRPKKIESNFYSLISEYTSEETFANNRQKFLSEQGYSYKIEHM